MSVTEAGRTGRRGAAVERWPRSRARRSGVVDSVRSPARAAPWAGIRTAAMGLDGWVRAALGMTRCARPWRACGRQKNGKPRLRSGATPEWKRGFASRGRDDAAVGGVPGPDGIPVVAAVAARIAGATGAWRDRGPLRALLMSAFTGGCVNRAYRSRTNPKAGAIPNDSSLSRATLITARL